MSPNTGEATDVDQANANYITIVSDHQRKPDADNPRGYFEIERIKDSNGNTAWIGETRGRAMKVISMLLYELPADYDYRVLFMRRDMEEILASQAEMLKRHGREVTDEEQMEISQHLDRHLKNVIGWLAKAEHMAVSYVNFSDLVSTPKLVANAVNRFLDDRLDVQSMRAVVDPSLHRQHANT